MHSRETRELGSLKHIDPALVSNAPDNTTAPTTLLITEEAAAEPVSAMGLEAWNASDRTLRDVKPSKSKSPRFWKFINTLVPKMVESDSEDEEDDPVGLEQAAPPGGTHPDDQEEHSDVVSTLSELAFGPSSRDGAKDAFKIVTENRDETIDETMKEGEAVGPQMLADQRSQQPKAATQQRGASVRAHEVKEAVSSRDDGSDLRSAVYSAHASRSSRFGSSAKFDDLSVPADSVCEENTLDSSVSPPVLDAAPTKDQPLGAQLLEEVPALRDTETDPPEAVTSDGSSKHPLESNVIGDVTLGSQPSLREFGRALHNGRKISSSKLGEVSTANREQIPIIWNMRLPIGAVVSKRSSRLPPHIIEQLLNNVSLVPWQRKAISSGRNPFLRTGNLGHVRPELQDVWTRHGTATILRFHLCSDLGSVGSSDTKKKSLLLELPSELREKIYFHVFQLQDKHQSHAKSHRQGHIETALLRTCRSIYFEARCMPLQVNEFQFERSLYAEFFNDRLSAPQQRCLRSLLVRAGTTDCYFNGLEMWKNLFNTLFELFARGTRLRTLTVVFEGPWDIEFESKIEAIWNPLGDALHFIDDFYLSIEDAEVCHEVKAGLHSKWATFLTGHAKEWPPLGTAHTSRIGTTFVPVPVSDVDGLDPSNGSLADDPSDTNGDLHEPDASTEAAAQTSHNHTAITYDESANDLTLDHPNIIDTNADAVAASFDNDDLQSNLSNVCTSRITEIFDDGQTEHPVFSLSPNHDQAPPTDDQSEHQRLTITKSENETTTASSPAHLEQHPTFTTRIPVPKRHAKPPRYQPPHKRQRLFPAPIPPASLFLTRLTPSLRALIYSHVFAIQDDTPAWHPRYFVGHIETSLLLANRQIWHEARLLPAALNTFSFACADHARRFLEALPEGLRKSVKRIRVFATGESFRWEYGRAMWTGLFRVVERLQRGEGGLLLESLTVVVQGRVNRRLGMDVRGAWRGLKGSLFPLGRFETVFEDERVPTRMKEEWEGAWGRWLVSGV